MKHIILGTAGHVDHGKTALIKALTGVDTDRLKEEKERGITIELGFAFLTMPNGQTVGVVDVPGHEKFVKNMVAGAGGIDLVVMVIAADEGVMPQTKEHLEICELLGIKRGMVALTKADLVDEEWLAFVENDVEEFLEGTFLEGCPIAPVSVVNGDGIPEFLSILSDIISDAGDRNESGFFRLPVDRVFTMRGFGTVVTGTLVSGKVKVGQTIEILPKHISARVRGIQVYNEMVEVARAGQRTAINLQGIERVVIAKGDMLTTPDVFEPSNRLDAFFRYLPSAKRKLKNRTIVRFHSGTTEIMARIILLDRDEMEPGDTAYVQILLQNSTILVGEDMFVIRSYSPVNTIGGGEILDPLARKHRRHSEEVIKELAILHGGTGQEKTGIFLKRVSLSDISNQKLSGRTGIPSNEQNKILEKMFSKKEALLLDKDDRTVISFPIYQSLQEKILLVIKAYHEKYPLKEGISKEELRVNIGEFVNPKLFNKAIRDLEREEKLVIEKENVRIVSHRIILKAELGTLKNNIKDIYMKSKIEPPTVKEILEKYSDQRNDVVELLTVMLNEGLLVKVSEDLYFYGEALDQLRKDYKNLLVEDGKVVPSSFRDMTGLSRKFTIPLMEYFDKTKLTIRVGDHRVLRESRTK